ncbi:MAG: hypothetical protein KDA91_14590 [Planctomycetaceae bacterium]|nr:hypothetical protein [Planctomycetaceae bacterium]
MRFQLFCVGIIAFSTSIIGCGGTDFGPMGSVSGRLTMDGQPLAEGTQLLFMQMEKGYAAFARTDAEGNYKLQWMREGKTWDEVPTGMYKILVQPPEVKNVEELDAEAMLAGADQDIQPAAAVFPRKYQQHSTSGLQFDVKEGTNTSDINLDSKFK